MHNGNAFHSRPLGSKDDVPKSRFQPTLSFILGSDDWQQKTKSHVQI